MGRYEEALERAKQGLPIDEVFPELKESEEERIREEIIRFLYAWRGDSKVDKWIAHLEKLKEQQPAEWSEEDKHCIHQLILFCENCMQQDSEAIRCSTWLKSLRHQPHWKPSKEQMEALNTAIETFERNDLCAGELVTLLLDLKKL